MDLGIQQFQSLMTIELLQEMNVYDSSRAYTSTKSISLKKKKLTDCDTKVLKTPMLVCFAMKQSSERERERER